MKHFSNYFYRPVYCDKKLRTLGFSRKVCKIVLPCTQGCWNRPFLKFTAPAPDKFRAFRLRLRLRLRLLLLLLLLLLPLPLSIVIVIVIVVIVIVTHSHSHGHSPSHSHTYNHT